MNPTCYTYCWTLPYRVLPSRRLLRQSILLKHWPYGNPQIGSRERRQKAPSFSVGKSWSEGRQLVVAKLSVRRAWTWRNSDFEVLENQISWYASTYFELSSECLLRLTPGCRLRSLRSLRPTLGLSRRLPEAANAAPALRVRQPEDVRRHGVK